VTVKRYSYSVPAGGVLDLIPLDQPMILEGVCAEILTNGAANTAALEVLNGESSTLFCSTCLNGTVAAPSFVQWNPAEQGNLVIGIGTAFPMGAALPRDLVVLPGETVRLTFAADMVMGGVVVTWREP